MTNPTRWVRPLVGAFLVLFGAWLLNLALAGAPIDRFRVWLSAGVMTLGALMIFPTKDSVKLIEEIGTYLPRAGGRRPADPPTGGPPLEVLEQRARDAWLGRGPSELVTTLSPDELRRRFMLQPKEEYGEHAEALADRPETAPRRAPAPPPEPAAEVSMGTVVRDD